MSKEPKCFIIQPLTEKYIERCDETYKPAIQAAGLYPYRVDEDHKVEKLRIQVIQEEIEKATVCLADISEINPNVWYEVGFADGHNVPVVLICREDARDKLPFDVNQRNVYFYDPETVKRIETLKEGIEKRLKMIMEERESREIEEAASRSGSQSDNVVSTGGGHYPYQYEGASLALLQVLYSDAEDDDQIRQKHLLRDRVKQLGFSSTAVTKAFDTLENDNMISSGTIFDEQGYEVWDDEGHHLHGYSLTQSGRNWCRRKLQED